MSKKIHPERLCDALMKDWDNRECVGIVIPPELEELIKRYLKWACTMSAESVIHKLLRILELTPHTDRKLQYNKVIEIIRKLDPLESDDYLKTVPRDYDIYIKTDETEKL